MPRASLLALVDRQENIDALNAWIDQWKDWLTYLSENKGCGCCVDSYDVEGPQEVIDTIPRHLLCGSGWASGKAAGDRA